MRILPDPELHTDWKGWARKVVGDSKQPEVVKPLQLPVYSIARLPPANANGLVVFVVDDETGAQPVYSRDGLWLRFDGNETC